MKRLLIKLKTQYNKYLRVWRLLKKPTGPELKLISKVTAIGLLVIGAIGFAISVVMKMMF
jgi:protein translocase SEC61 complex gamma subunit